MDAGVGDVGGWCGVGGASKAGRGEVVLPQRGLAGRRMNPWGPGTGFEPELAEFLKTRRPPAWALAIWGSISGQIWCQLGPILDPKTFPKGCQVGSKIDPSWGVDLGAVFEWILGQLLLIFRYNMTWPK